MRMTPYDAVGILDGFVECPDAETYLEAARFIRDHGPRGILHGNGTRDAIALADYADKHGDDAAIESLGG